MVGRATTTTLTNPPLFPIMHKLFLALFLVAFFASAFSQPEGITEGITTLAAMEAPEVGGLPLPVVGGLLLRTAYLI
ncbi:hypothetical protein L596_029171 [Steinernema carpocapsae]|uniref:Uncharacterized protein n=1 Tax=Steinernema carpocapsae TaxID=34508 RepID=A0A4U5LTV0_STECR|nr:hypothetical protein L596_029171 [Steinernema carpocapsae]